MNQIRSFNLERGSQHKLLSQLSANKNKNDDKCLSHKDLASISKICEENVKKVISSNKLKDNQYLDRNRD